MKKKIRNILILGSAVGLAFFQCSKKQERPMNQEPFQQQTQTRQPKEDDNPIISKGDFYFEFDELIHYKWKMDIDPYDLYEKDVLSKEEQITVDYFFEDLPKDLNDKSLVKDIESRYKKTYIDTSLYADIKEIFREKKHRKSVDYSCIAEFRDILIFRKKKKIVGLAKICFTCDTNHILGTTKNTQDFGQSGDYDKLQALLYK